MAHLEHASVSAFETLSRELLAHGAPARLVRGASRAAREETRHAGLMRSLARVEGGVSHVAAVVASAPIRSLEAIAIENAVEGCVRETYGALVAHWQSRSADAPDVREVMSEIARDETGHAALALQIDAWARSRLEPEARARLDAATRAAIAGLASECEATVPREVVSGAGVPQRDTARLLLDGAKRLLWS